MIGGLIEASAVASDLPALRHAIPGDLNLSDRQNPSASRWSAERRAAASHYDTAASKAMRAAFSPIMIDGALVLPDVKVGMIEASATRRPAIPWTRS